MTHLNPSVPPQWLGGKSHKVGQPTTTAFGDVGGIRSWLSQGDVKTLKRLEHGLATAVPGFSTVGLVPVALTGMGFEDLVVVYLVQESTSFVSFISCGCEMDDGTIFAPLVGLEHRVWNPATAKSCIVTYINTIDLLCSRKRTIVG